MLAKLLCILMLAEAALPGRSTPVRAPAPVDFLRDIQPIFAASCTGCHGPEKRQGQLRLDGRAAAFRGGASGAVILPGDANGSLLYKMLVHPEPEERMPRKASALPARQIQLVRAWIETGASWPESAAGGGAVTAADRHWAYVRPLRPRIPEVARPGWIRNPIDAFVLSRLERAGEAPAPEAARETLIRRVTLDLTGLPPTPAEVDAFVADPGPHAYERVVDRLLASFRYGERWARLWLDLARYADSNGFDQDNLRVMWKYRDWVIAALNQDMPFDRFTIEQIAGDMLENPTIDQRVASGFHANTMLNLEGGVDGAEARFDVLVDRVNTTASVWLGTTLGCAQCHNHKYDPFSQKDYYGLLAFFDNGLTDVLRRDGDNSAERDPTIALPSPEQEAALRSLEAETARHRRILDTPTPALAAAQARWAAASRRLLSRWRTIDPESATASSGGRLEPRGDGSLLASGAGAANDRYTIIARAPVRRAAAFRLELLPDPSLPASGPGRGANGGFVVSELEVAVARRPGVPFEPLRIAEAAADESTEGWTIAHAIDGRPDTGWAAAAGKPHVAVFRLEKPARAASRAIYRISIAHDTVHPHHALGRFRLSATDAPDALATLRLPGKIQQLLRAPPGSLGTAERGELAAHHRTITPLLQPARDAIARLPAAAKALAIPTAVVMRERVSFEQPSTRFRIRGSFSSPGERVYARVPAALPPLGEGQPANRLGLARWLVDGQNPLTARVTVNRFWEQLFGRGLVETSEDFGTQGSPPSHPELLDWLATELVTSAWSLKALQRLIVTSATYRQAAAATPRLLAKDPFNGLLARGPRFRIEAEMIRDGALASSGLLSSKVGGPSVFPWQPDGIWNVSRSSDEWRTSSGEDRHRRGIYTFLRRSAPYPMLTTFDGTGREVCTLRRTRTNTPLQALNLLNDPTFFEAARALAARIVREAGPDPRARAERGFRLCLARRPTAEEIEALLTVERREKDRLAGDGGAVTAILDLPDGATTTEVGRETAAWTLPANVLLNLDETVTKE